MNNYTCNINAKQFIVHTGQDHGLQWRKSPKNTRNTSLTLRVILKVMYQNPLAGKSLESQRKNTNITTVTQVTVKTKVITDQGGSTKRNQKSTKNIKIPTRVTLILGKRSVGGIPTQSTMCHTKRWCKKIKFCTFLRERPNLKDNIGHRLSNLPL